MLALANAAAALAGFAPARWVKVADLRFFEPFKRAMERRRGTARYALALAAAARQVVARRWIAFYPASPLLRWTFRLVRWTSPGR